MNDKQQKRHPLGWKIILVLLIPVVPFLALGWWLEPTIEAFAETAASQPKWIAASIIFSALAVDIFLPVPSTVLMTFAGKFFGAAGGALVGWMGLNLSAGIGYWGCRICGDRWSSKAASEEDLRDVKQIDRAMMFDGWPLWWALFACRPLPVLAEASVLLAGLERISASAFWPPVLIGNLLVASVCAWLGATASENEWFTTAVVISMLLPIVFIMGRFVLKRWGVSVR